MKASRPPGSKAGRRGHAVIEVALMAPWLLFLFVGTFDIGYYTYSLIAAENAARVAAEYASQNTTTAVDQAGACRYVLAEMSTLPNVRNLSAWRCNAVPLQVTATLSPTGPDGHPATSVTVTYQTPMLVPIPGLTGSLSITRNAQMRLRN